MSHPQPPPNCPYFDCYNVQMGWRFNIPGVNGQFLWLDDTLDRSNTTQLCWKNIISAVAEKFWRLEKDRLIHELKLAMTYDEEYKKKEVAMKRCTEMIDQWRRWCVGGENGL